MFLSRSALFFSHCTTRKLLNLALFGGLLVCLTVFYLTVSRPYTRGFSATWYTTNISESCPRYVSDRKWPDVEKLSCHGPGRRSPSCPRFTGKLHMEWLKTVLSENSISEEEVNEVKFLLLFLGHGRSGGSITGQLLNSHPNMLVANQFMLFHEMIYNPEYFETKSDVIRILAQASLNPDPFLSRIKFKKTKGYRIAVKGVHVNDSEHAISDSRTPIMVVGDKGAGRTVHLYGLDKEKFSSLLERLRANAGIPIKFIEIIRNPFDIIATDVIYNLGGARERQKVVNSEVKISGKENNGVIACSIKKYFENAFAMVKMVPELQMDVLQVHLTDLVTNPRRELQRMCDFLEVECMEEFLVNCENTLFKELSKSRTSIDWTDEQKWRIENLAGEISLLTRYSFEND